MQRVFKEWLESKNIEHIDEFTVGQVQRRADFLLLKGGSLINVEAKCHPSDILMAQLKDHAAYCDYSFALLPDFCMTPVWWKKSLVEHGYGLIIYNYDNYTITEVLEAHHNKPQNKWVRSNVTLMIRQAIKKRVQKENNQTKCF